jgi:hypothetical protein
VIRKLALLFALLMITFLFWPVLAAHYGVSITVNGRSITGPFDALIALGGLIITLVILLCVAILVALVLAGVGLLVLGCLALVGLILAVVAFPFLLPILIPLFIIWLICSIARSIKAA